MSATPKKKTWKGYNFDEIREQIVLNDARIMIQKIKIQDDIKALRTARSNNKSTFKKLFSALSYVDYIVMGITLIRKLRPLFKAFKKKN